MTVFNITIYLDTVCAWCFIGHRTVDQAIALYQRTYPGGRADTFNLDFHPFYLRPTAPGEVEAVPLRDAWLEKNWTVEKVEAIKTKMQHIGQAHGIRFNYDSKVGSTRLSHLLVYQAGRVKGRDVQKQVVEGLYCMHFEQGGDITGRAELVGVAKGIGVEEAEAESWLNDEAIGVRVDE